MKPTALLSDPANQSVLAYLTDLSAHSDIASALIDAVRPLGGARWYCPNLAAYRYVAAYTGNVIFAFANGMNILGFRLEENLHARALASGGALIPACGPEWIQFTLFRADGPRVDPECWAREAYTAARKSPR